MNRRGTSQGVEEEGAIKQLHAFSCFLLSVSGLVQRWDQDCIQGPDPKKERKKREIRNGVTTRRDQAGGCCACKLHLVMPTLPRFVPRFKSLSSVDQKLRGHAAETDKKVSMEASYSISKL